MSEAGLANEVVSGAEMLSQATLLDGVVATYGPLLLDMDLIFGVILAWAITAFFKKVPAVVAMKPDATRKFRVRAVSAVIGFVCVIAMKVDTLQTQPGLVIQLAVLVAFTHGFIYLIFMALLSKIFPNAAEILKGNYK